MHSAHNQNHGHGHDFVSPVSAGATRPHDGFDSVAADAPEVAEVQSPSTVVASPVTTDDSANSPEVAKQYVYGDDNTKEVVYYGTGGRTSLPVEHQYAQDPQATADLYASNGDAEKAKKQGGASANDPSKGPQKKILGMSRKMFFIVLALVCIVIAAAVGGGVGASVSKKSKSGEPDEAESGSGEDSPSASPTSSSPPSGTEASSTSGSPSATASPLPTFLNETNFDSGYGFQGFSKENFTGIYSDNMVKEIRESLVTVYDFDIHSYLWVAKITNCCVAFCKNGTKEGNVGWRCQSYKQNVASETFSRTSIWCNNEKPNDEIAAEACAKPAS